MIIIFFTFTINGKKSVNKVKKNLVLWMCLLLGIIIKELNIV
jgi:hypothetical protein